mgnify:CR=1 FL=1
MSNVIGYKGTRYERAGVWNALRIYKGSLNFYGNRSTFKEASDMERAIYQELLERYVH